MNPSNGNMQHGGMQEGFIEEIVFGVASNIYKSKVYNFT